MWWSSTTQCKKGVRTQSPCGDEQAPELRSVWAPKPHPQQHLWQCCCTVFSFTLPARAPASSPKSVLTVKQSISAQQCPHHPRGSWKTLEKCFLLWVLDMLPQNSPLLAGFSAHNLIIFPLLHNYQCWPRIEAIITSWNFRSCQEHWRQLIGEKNLDFGSAENFHSWNFHMFRALTHVRMCGKHLWREQAAYKGWE